MKNSCYDLLVDCLFEIEEIELKIYSSTKRPGRCVGVFAMWMCVELVDLYVCDLY